MRISEFCNGDLQIEGDDGDLVIVEGIARFVPTRDSQCPCGGSLSYRPAMTVPASRTACVAIVYSGTSIRPLERIGEYPAVGYNDKHPAQTCSYLGPDPNGFYIEPVW
jgi:hypothetical protein